MDRTEKVTEHTDQGRPAHTGYTDDFIARDLVEFHFLDQWRYVAAWGRWMHWNGTKWAEEKTLKVFDEVRKVCRLNAEEALADQNLKEAHKGRVFSELCSRSKHVAVEAIARSDRFIAAVVEQWDADLDILNTPDGEINLRSGVRSFNRLDSYCSKSTAVGAVEGAPIWHKFLNRITDGNQELIAYLARMAGYFLTGQTSEHALFFCYGAGANGKSTFIGTIIGLMGDYAMTAPITMFTESAFERHPTDLASLRGSRLVASVETEANKRWNESLLKSLSGGDTVSARFMRQDSFTYMPQFKLLFAGNHKPALQNVDAAMRRRFHLIPFTNTIAVEERDHELPAKLRAEWPGILDWAIAGAMEWRAVGLMPPTVVRDATAAYLDDEDSFGTWLSERTAIEARAVTAASDLFADYRGWCEKGAEKYMPSQRFSQELQRRGYPRVKRRDCSVYEGLVLRQLGLAA